MSQTLNGNVKNNGTYNTFRGSLSQEWIDGRQWSPALICHANQGNEYVRNFDSNHVTTSYQVGCIDKSRNIPGLKQRNIHKQGIPSVDLQFWNPQTQSRVGNLTKANQSHLP